MRSATPMKVIANDIAKKKAASRCFFGKIWSGLVEPSWECS